MIFSDGVILEVNPATGAASQFGTLFTDPLSFSATTAICLNAANNLLYAIIQPAEGETARTIVTYGLVTGAIATTLIQPLIDFNAAKELPFEMNYIPCL